MRAPLEFLSSHPHPEKRLETIREFLQQNRPEIESQDLTHGRELR